MDTIDAIVRPLIRAPRLLPKLVVRSTPALDTSGVAARDLARYYALLERERPGTIVAPCEACLIRDVLPDFRAHRRDDPEVTLATVIEKHARSEDASVYEVDVPALVERLRGPGPSQLLAVIDLAERMHGTVLRGGFEAREQVRREFGISG